MKAAVSILLAVSLVTLLPITKLLAQTAEQDPTAADATFVAEDGSKRLLGIPALTPESALIWLPIVESHARVLGETGLPNPAPVTGWSDWSTEKRVWVLGGIFVGLVILGVVSIG